MVEEREAINGNGKQFLDETSIGHRSYNPLSNVLSFPDRKNGNYQEKVLECAINVNPVKRDRNSNVMQAEGSAKSVPSNDDGQP